MRHLLYQTAMVTSRAASSTDTYGNAVYATIVRGPFQCRIDDSTSAEDTIDRETVRSSRKGFFMPEADIKADDVVQVGPATYRVVGDPMQRANATSVHHIEAALEEVRP
jgi:hypothetical protein